MYREIQVLFDCPVFPAGETAGSRDEVFVISEISRLMPPGDDLFGLQGV
jgi:hypothetical protein